MFVSSELSSILQLRRAVTPNPNDRISHVVIDSRQIVHGAESLFVAIIGKRTDGHKYIQDAAAFGVRNFIIGSDFDPASLVACNVFIVDDTIQALQLLAAAHRRKFQIPCIAITGSNGKTWIKEWLFQLLLADFNIVKSPRSYNSQIGAPLSVLLTTSGHDLAIFEAGISEKGEMALLEQVIQPDIGILTHLGDAHDAGFTSREEKLKEKCALFANAKVVVYPAHDLLIARRIPDYCPHCELISWGRHEDATLRVLEIVSSNQSSVSYIYDGIQYAIDIPFGDNASIENAITSCLVLHYLNIPPQDIARRMLNLRPVKMRLEMHSLANNCLLIDDSYSLDLESLQIGLETLGQHSHGRVKALIISDIEKQHTDDYHKVASMVQAHNVDIVHGIGDQIKRIAGFIGDDTRFSLHATVRDFIRDHPWESSNNSAFLLKGARRFGFERIVRAMRGRSHSAVLEIDLNAMLENLQYFAGMLSPTTQIIAMVKASAYGSGSVEVGKFLEHNNVDRLCVANADEGVELRRAGVSVPIMVLNPDRRNLDKLIDFRLEPEIYDLDFLRFLGKAVRQSGNHIGIHVKLDTGMHRLGFDTSEIRVLIDALSQHANVRVVSVFTHLAAADDPEDDAFTLSQINRFEECYEEIVAVIGYRPMKHALNTHGILRFPEFQFDAVRLGIGLYGVGINCAHELTPVHIMKARVSQVRKVAAGETVGYGRAFRADRDSIIATINAGYADGIPRRTGGSGYAMYLRHAIAPVAGRVCMDMCMLDVTDIPDVAQGDEVEVFGHNASIETLARLCQTIPYEILTGISERIPRVFKFD